MSRETKLPVSEIPDTVGGLLKEIDKSSGKTWVEANEAAMEEVPVFPLERKRKRNHVTDKIMAKLVRVTRVN